MKRLAIAAIPAILFHAFLLLWDGPQGASLGPSVQRLVPLRMQLAMPAAPSPTPGARSIREKTHSEPSPETVAPAPPPSQPPATPVREKSVPLALEKNSVPKDHQKSTIVPQKVPARAASSEMPAKVPSARTPKKSESMDKAVATASRGQDMDAVPLSSPKSIQAITAAGQPAESFQAASLPATGAAAGVFLAQPLYKKNPPPDYPRKARRRGYQGVVDLAVLVDADGRVKDLKVAASSGYGLLDRAAVRAVQQWVFQPGSHNGNKMEMWVEVPIRFAIK